MNRRTCEGIARVFWKVGQWVQAPGNWLMRPVFRGDDTNRVWWKLEHIFRATETEATYIMDLAIEKVVCVTDGMCNREHHDMMKRLTQTPEEELNWDTV